MIRDVRLRARVATGVAAVLLLAWVLVPGAESVTHAESQDERLVPEWLEARFDRYGTWADEITLLSEGGERTARARLRFANCDGGPPLLVARLLGPAFDEQARRASIETEVVDAAPTALSRLAGTGRSGLAAEWCSESSLAFLEAWNLSGIDCEPMPCPLSSVRLDLSGQRVLLLDEDDASRPVMALACLPVSGDVVTLEAGPLASHSTGMSVAVYPRAVDVASGRLTGTVAMTAATRLAEDDIAGLDAMRSVEVAVTTGGTAVLILTDQPPWSPRPAAAFLAAPVGEGGIEATLRGLRFYDADEFYMAYPAQGWNFDYDIRGR